MATRGDPLVATTNGLLTFNGGGNPRPVVANNGSYYQVYADAANDVVYKKAADALGWGSAVAIFTGTTTAQCTWYDRWSGLATDLIATHYQESVTDDAFFRSIDTGSADALGTQTAPFTGASTASGGCCSIVRARGGNYLVAGTIDNGTESYCARSVDAGANWTNRTSPMEGATQDQIILMPGFAADNQDLIAVFWDASADEISRKVYDDSANSWAETSIATSMVDTVAATSFPHFDAAPDLTNSQLVVVAWSAVDTANADLRCWKVTEGAITEVTNVVLNSTDDQHLCGVGICTDDDSWYVVYGGASGGAQTVGTSIHLYYKRSTDQGSTWGAETRLTTTQQNIKWLAVPARFSGAMVVAYHVDTTTDEVRVNAQATTTRGQTAFEGLGTEKVLLLRSSGGPTNSSGNIGAWTNLVSGGAAFSTVGGAVASYVSDPNGDATGPAMLVDTAERGITSGYDPATAWLIATGFKIRSGNAADDDTYRNLIVDENTDEIGVYLNIGTVSLHAFYGTTDDTGPTLVVDTLYELAFVKDATNTKTYVNGAEVMTQANEGQLTDLCIGTAVSGSGTFAALGCTFYCVVAYDEALTGANLEKLHALVWDEMNVGLSAGAYTLAAAAGSFTETGNATGLLRGLKMAAALGTFALTGSAAALNHGFPLAAATASFSLTGQVFALKRSLVMAAAVGAFVETGSAVALNHGFIVPAAAGPFSLTGVAAALSYSGAGGAYSLAAGAGSFALTGTAATFPRAVRMAAAAGAFVEAGSAAGLLAGRLLLAQAAGFSLTGNPAGTLRGLVAGGSVGSFALTGNPAGARASRILSASAAPFILSGTAALLAAGRRLGAGAGTFSEVGNAVALAHGYSLTAAGASFGMTGQSAATRRALLVSAGAASFTVTGIGALLTYLTDDVGSAASVALAAALETSLTLGLSDPETLIAITTYLETDLYLKIEP